MLWQAQPTDATPGTLSAQPWEWQDSDMPLTVPTWIAAIATAALALGAGFTVYYARKAFREQANELGVLQKQAKDQANMLEVQSAQLDAQHDQLHAQQEFNAQQAPVLALQAKELQESLDERKRAQAAQIFLELGRIPPVTQVTVERDQPEPEPLPWRLVATIYNTSRQPAYDFVVRWQVGGLAYGSPAGVARIGPDRAQGFEYEIPLSADESTVDAVLEFRDAAGIRWQVTSRGELTDLSEPVRR